jgi:hypothetical protein
MLFEAISVIKNGSRDAVVPNWFGVLGLRRKKLIFKEGSL